MSKPPIMVAPKTANAGSGADFCVNARLAACLWVRTRNWEEIITTTDVLKALTAQEMMHARGFERERARHGLGDD